MRPAYLQWPRRRMDNPSELDAYLPQRLPPAPPARIYHQRPLPGARRRRLARLAFPLGVCIALVAAAAHIAGYA